MSRYAVIWAYAGIMVGIVLFVLCRSHPEWWTNNGFVYRFQTLIGAVVAIFAAFVGGGAVYHQTASARAEERRLRRIQEIAARAALPHLLSDLIEYCEGWARTLNEVRNQFHGRSLSRSGIRYTAPPRVTAEMLSGLKQASIELGDPAREAVALINLGLQLQSARVRDLLSYLERKGHVESLVLTVANLDSYAIDTAVIYARAEKLYPYARLKSGEALEPIMGSDVTSALSKLRYEGLDDDFTYYKLLDQRQDQEWPR